MAATSLANHFFDYYVRQQMPPNEARAKALDAASNYLAQSGLSEEEVLAQLRERQEAADWRSFANQVLSKAPVISETPRRGSTQRMLGAGALATSLNPEDRAKGEAELQRNRIPQSKLRAAQEQRAAEEDRARRTALFDEKMKRGAVRPGPNASPEAIASYERLRRPYDVSGMTGVSAIRPEEAGAIAEAIRGMPDESTNLDSGMIDAALTASRNAAAREALDLSANEPIPEGGQSYRYDQRASSNGTYQPVTEQAKSILRARLSEPMRAGPGESVTPASELEEPPQELVGATPGGALVQGAPQSQNGAPDLPAGGMARSSLPSMASTSGSGILGFRGGAYTPGTSWDRSTALGTPFRSFPATLGVKSMWSSAARTDDERAPARPATTTTTARDMPVPPKRPVELTPATEQGNQSLFSSILERLKPQDPYAGMSRQEMGREAQRLQSSGDEYGANLLTQRLDRSITSPDQQSSDGGFKRGGTAKAGGGMHKDAALHKALDIIHAMLQRGR
jgi:hypothetical protein